MHDVSFGVIVLAGGQSKRFSEDKGLFLINGKPLSYFIISTVSQIVSDIVVVVKTESQKNNYESLLSNFNINIIPDNSNIFAPLVGLYTGLKNINTDYVLVLPVDTPLISPEFVHFILSFAPSHGAVIPRWPSGYIEPLHSVYHTNSTREIVHDLLDNKEYRVHKIIDELRNVLYVSTEVFRQIDPNLYSFMNINTRADLSKITNILKKRNL